MGTAKDNFKESERNIKDGLSSSQGRSVKNNKLCPHPA
jgi:hypothetical protein